jgi:hypothetical protein
MNTESKNDPLALVLFMAIGLLTVIVPETLGVSKWVFVMLCTVVSIFHGAMTKNYVSSAPLLLWSLWTVTLGDGLLGYVPWTVAHYTFSLPFVLCSLWVAFGLEYRWTGSKSYRPRPVTMYVWFLCLLLAATSQDDQVWPVWKLILILFYFMLHFMFISIGSRTLAHNTVSSLWLLYTPAFDPFYWTIRFAFAIMVISAWLNLPSTEEPGKGEEDDVEKNGSTKAGKQKLTMIPVKESHRERVRRMSTQRMLKLEPTPKPSFKAGTSSVITNETLKTGSSLNSGLIDESSLSEPSITFTRSSSKRSRNPVPSSFDEEKSRTTTSTTTTTAIVDEKEVESYTQALNTVLRFAGFITSE